MSKEDKKEKKVVGETIIEVKTIVFDDGSTEVIITPMGGGTGGPPCDPKINPFCP